MRIIAGKYGSRPLRSLGGLDLRPTSDRLRETVFNILGPSVAGSVFVDLYAGTGAVGIEALSRGADEVFFVEKHPGALALIHRNLGSLGIRLSSARPGRPRLVRQSSRSDTARPAKSTVEFPAEEAHIEVLPMDAVKSLELLHSRHVLADFVFLDPPYSAAEEYTRALDALSEAHVLAPAGRVIVESLRLAKKPPAKREPDKGGQTEEALPELRTRASGWEPPDRIGSLERTRTVEQGDSLLAFYRLAQAA